jgi:hypothetical protein
MKIRLLPLSLIFGLAIAPGLRAQAPAPAPAPAAPTAPAAGKDDGDTELGDKMDKVSSAYKKLRKSIPDATQNEASLKQVAIIHDAATDALNLTPAKAADLPEADRAKFVADFQAEMKKFIGKVDDLAAALKANDNAGAQKIFDDMGQQEKDDHKEFRKPKPKK